MVNLEHHATMLIRRHHLGLTDDESIIDRHPTRFPDRRRAATLSAAEQVAEFLGGRDALHGVMEALRDGGTPGAVGAARRLGSGLGSGPGDAEAAGAEPEPVGAEPDPAGLGDPGLAMRLAAYGRQVAETERMTWFDALLRSAAEDDASALPGQNAPALRRHLSDALAADDQASWQRLINPSTLHDNRRIFVEQGRLADPGSLTELLAMAPRLLGVRVVVIGRDGGETVSGPPEGTTFHLVRPDPRNTGTTRPSVARTCRPRSRRPRCVSTNFRTSPSTSAGRLTSSSRVMARTDWTTPPPSCATRCTAASETPR
ncbi:hypothetical protein [Plantactinospora sp. KBS50]|uniref:hypothetical protein n=1 Tax=Plantactinospora sp. KBS50 TaxID=2024580 RepID=UPI0012FDF6A1|nr:hypothetical protein [Plantactinospora sp. KBS50]